MTDQFAGQEIAGHENDGPKMTAVREVAGEQIELTEYLGGKRGQTDTCLLYTSPSPRD